MKDKGGLLKHHCNSQQTSYLSQANFIFILDAVQNKFFSYREYTRHISSYGIILKRILYRRHKMKDVYLFNNNFPSFLPNTAK